jgi:hypothetical protein
MVSEKVLRIPLGDLRTVRIVCQRDTCGAVSEMLLDRICDRPDVHEYAKCHRCGQPFHTDRNSFGKAMDGLCFAIGELTNTDLAGQVAIEFPVAIESSDQRCHSK